jgi:lipoprotein-anchoring transpeptidase ErfK/SrfK
VQRQWIKAYVDYLDQTFRRAPVSARYLGLQGLKPAVSPARYGARVAKGVMIERISRNLVAGRRVPIELAFYSVAPKKLAKDFDRPEIVIRRLSNKLFLYRGPKLVRTFGVATGSSVYPTPTGNYKVVDMQKWPWWYPPNSSWARGASPIPPGPGNPLGTRWMGLNVYGVGMHGTPDDASIGYSASHGCIRMHIPDAEWLFDHITLGTPVHIVDA